MAFELARAFPVQVTVHGIAHGQMIINTFGYRANDELSDGAGSSSTVFLDDFINLWRVNVIPIMYTAYSVYRYWLRVIMGALPVPGSSPVRYVPEYGPFQDYVPGHVTSDVGGKAIVGDYLPSFCAMTLVRKHALVGRRYWQSSVRISPMAEADQGVVANTFSSARMTEVDTAFEAIADTEINDGLGATDDWHHATFSPTYRGRVSPAGSMRSSTNLVLDYSPNSLVSTQTSRRIRSNAGG